MERTLQFRGAMSPWCRVLIATAFLSAARRAWCDAKDQCIKSSESGQSLRDEQHLTAARAEFLGCARDVCPAIVRKDCIESANEIDARIPTVVIRVYRGSEDLTAVELTIDGTFVTNMLDGKPMRLDPGQHTIHFALGSESVDRNVLLVEGERDRAVVVSFEEAKGRKPPLFAIGTGALGLVALGVGAVFYAVGLNQHASDLGGNCSSAEPNLPPQTSCADERDSIRTKLAIGDVLTGAGAAAFGVGLVWTIVHFARGHVDASPTRGGALLRGVWTF